MIRLKRPSRLLVRMMIKKLAILLLFVPALAAGGCNYLGYLLYLIAPAGPSETVPAAFDRLAGKKVAVLVFTDEAVQIDYPYARWTISRMVEAELQKHVKGVRVVEPSRVIKYQDQNVHWESMEKAKIGKDLGADFVLHLAIVEFSTLEPGSMTLYRGRITAEPSIYDVAHPKRRPWRGVEVRVVHPAKSPGQYGQNDQLIRYKTERIFAEQLVKYFYKHKVPKKE